DRSRKAGEPIADLMTGATSRKLRPAFQPEHLNQIGEGTVASQQTAHGDGSLFQPPMAFVKRGGAAEIHRDGGPARTALLGLQEQRNLFTHLGLIVLGGPDIVAL